MIDWNSCSCWPRVYLLHSYCCGLNMCVPPKVICWNISTNVMVLRQPSIKGFPENFWLACALGEECVLGWRHGSSYHLQGAGAWPLLFRGGTWDAIWEAGSPLAGLWFCWESPFPFIFFFFLPNTPCLSLPYEPNFYSLSVYEPHFSWSWDKDPIFS